MIHRWNRTDLALLLLTLVTFAAYAVILATAFWDLPLDIPPEHQFLLLYAHCIPMFFLELLLCRRANWAWRLRLPVLLLAIPGVWFLATAEWYLLAWVLVGWWCVAPAAGCLLAWMVWGVQQCMRHRKRPDET